MLGTLYLTPLHRLVFRPEIDRLVYKLYDLTEEEIAIVEEAIKK
jgi:hypothetical protein